MASLIPWLAIGYPILAHLGVSLHNLYLQWLALVWLCIVMLAGPLTHKRVWAVFALAAAAVTSYFLTMRGSGRYALYLPPIAIPAFIFWLFARSLRTRTMPLVTQIATTMRGEPLPQVLVAYTRRVTQLWCGVAAGLFLSAVGFALWANVETWSWVTNILHYLVMGAIFVLEFAYRRIRYAHLEPWGLTQYVRRLARVRIRIGP